MTTTFISVVLSLARTTIGDDTRKDAKTLLAAKTKKIQFEEAIRYYAPPLLYCMYEKNHKK